jgi:hypothetical protein
MKPFSRNKSSSRGGKIATNLALLLVGILLALGSLELALRIGNFDRRMGPRSYDVKGYEFSYHVSLNSDYFRDDEFEKNKPPSTFRIFLIGDSFVFGCGAGEKETIDKLLEARLNQNSSTHYEVFSLGHPGDTPFEYEETARRFRDYHPDLVILSFYVDNDVWKEEFDKHVRILGLWDNIVRRFQTYLYQHGYTQCLFPWLSKIKMDPFYQQKFCSGEINPFLALAHERPELHRSYEEFVDLFKNVPDTKEKILQVREAYPNAPFWILLQPSKYQVSDASFDTLRKIGFKIDSNQPVNRRLQDEIISWANSQGIETLDLLPSMRPEDGERYYHLIDDHYTGAGDEFVAEQIEKKLLGRKNSPESGSPSP